MLDEVRYCFYFCRAGEDDRNNNNGNSGNLYFFTKS